MYLTSLHYLVKLEMPIVHLLPLSYYRKKHQNLSYLSCILQIRQFESSYNSMWEILQDRDGVGLQNTHHWSGAVSGVTDKWLPQWRHDPAWTTPFLVGVLVRSDQWCVFCTHCLAIVPHDVINWIQIWQILGPQLRRNKFWSFFMQQLNNSTCPMSISSFTR